MRICRYIYCKHTYSDKHERCPVCGYPADGSEVDHIDIALSRIPKLPVSSIIDMHQIIINRDSILDAQLEMMRGIGIEAALLQSVPSKVESIWSNRKLLQLQRTHPDKFIVSHFMDPRHPLARKRLKQYRDRGVRVIKLLPCLGYQPDHPRWARFWKTIETLGLVAMVHTGFITARHKEEERRSGVFLNSKYGRPIFFDVLARKHPGIQFILCHMGGSIWVHEAVEMVNQHENVWGDLSGSGMGALKRIAKERVSVDWTKLFWGNDSSPFTYPNNLKLLLHFLAEGELEDQAALLLHNNARCFINRFLS